MRWFLVFLGFFVATQATFQPIVSMICSVYNNDLFIEHFMKEIVKQTIFNQSELIMISGNSPGNEDAVILRYQAIYPENIRFVRLPTDPGIPACLNMAVRMARAPYIAMANVDDNRHHRHLEIHAVVLDVTPHADLVYGGHWLTYYPNETFEKNRRHAEVYTMKPHFSPRVMNLCLPGPHPVWRKSMHDRAGYFDTSYRAAGDLEMWNRAVSKGSFFAQIPGVWSLSYLNPNGMSTKADSPVNVENQRIREKYLRMWQGEKIEVEIPHT